MSQYGWYWFAATVGVSLTAIGAYLLARRSFRWFPAVVAVAVVGPHEDWAAALVRSAGAAVFAQGPDHEAPVHAFATAEAVLLTAAGASGFGTQAADGPLRAEYLGRLLRDLNPACPPVRAV